MSRMDLQLPGTPVAIDMDDDLQELDDAIGRAESSMSSASIPLSFTASRLSTRQSDGRPMTAKSTSSSAWVTKSIPKLPNSALSSKRNLSRPGTASSRGVTSPNDDLQRPASSNSQRSTAAESNMRETPISQPEYFVESQRPPSKSRSIFSRLSNKSIPNLPGSVQSVRSTSSSSSNSTSKSTTSLPRPLSAKSALRNRSTTSPRPPTSSSRPRTSDSRKSDSKSYSGSSGGSLGSRISMSNLDADDDADKLWRTKLRPNCFLPHLSEKFLCPACTDVLYYPVQLSNCDHQVCSSCLSDIMRGVKCCPIDKKPIDRSQVIVRRDFTRELNLKKLSCPQSDVGCQWIGDYEHFRDHYISCEHAETSCPNGCGFRGEKRLIDNHVMKECSLRSVTCEFCNRAVRAEKEIDHLKQCPRFPVSCSNSCGKKQIPREELTKHVEEECPFGEIKCPFKRMGCYVTGTREFIKRHIADDLTNHMELLCQCLNETSDKLDDHEQRMIVQEEKIQKTVLQVSNIVRMQGCQLLWKIDNWAQRVIEANSGKKTILKSPPFFTGKYGYKLAMTLMPNGDGKAKGNSVSVYVCVCKGEYDALATWPFSMTVTFTLIDQCQDPMAKVDHSYVLRPNPCKENMPFLGRPIVNANPSFGAQSFAPVALLETRDYVRDDVIFMKIQTEHEA